MSWQLLGVSAAIYVWVAVDYHRTGNNGLALAFAAYAVANVGFMLDLWAAQR